MLSGRASSAIARGTTPSPWVDAMGDGLLGTLQLENEALRTQLAQTAAELDAIFRALPDLYFRVDAGGIILDYRAGRASDLYDTPNVFLGKRMQDVLPPDVGAICANAIARSLATEAKVRVEYSLPLPSGEEWFEGHVIPFTEEQVILLVHKVTEQRRDKEELHRMNAELETRVAERTAALEAANGSLRVFRALADNAPDAIALARSDATHVYENAACRALFRLSPEGGPRPVDITSRLSGEARRPGRGGPGSPGASVMSDTVTCEREDGTVFQAHVTAFAVEGDAGQAPLSAYILRDVSALLEAEAQRISLQDQIIEAQRAALRDLSTPLMPLADHVVAMPLIGSVDPARAAQLIEVLLQAVEEHSAHTVLLDVTGVPSIDGQVADALVRAAKAVSLLGAQLVLTGIRPEVAQTLVRLEVDLRGLITRSSLEQGIAYALGRRG